MAVELYEQVTYNIKKHIQTFVIKSGKIRIWYVETKREWVEQIGRYTISYT